MIILEVLLILTCYRGVIVEGLGNGSLPQMNNTGNSTTNVTVISPMGSAGSNESVGKGNKRELPTIVTNSSGYPQPTRVITDSLNATNATQDGNRSVDTTFPNITEDKRNELFFSNDFQTRLASWKKTLINASRHCIKLNYSKTNIGKNLEIGFPVFRAKGDCEGAFVSFDTLHPVLVRPNSGHYLVNIAYLAILELWPLLLLCFSCAALSGILVWLLDSRSNSEQFPMRFWRGIFDGIWWAVVTMTTVGYGDKSPKSFFARLFATAWMVTGIILLSMFFAQVSARLTTQELKSATDDHLFGKTIAVPPGLYYSDYVDYKMPYSIVEEVEKPIETASILSQMELDSMVVFHCNVKNQDEWEVLQFMPACEVGAEVNFNTQLSSDELKTIDADHNYAKCMKAMIRMNWKSHRMRSKGYRKDEKKPHKTCNKLLEDRDNLKFQFKWVYFQNLSQYLIPFGAVIGTIVLAFIIGSIWECRKKRKSCKNSNLEGSESQPGLMLEKSSAAEKEPMINENSKC